ncbi:MAG: LamG domain-containing protein, partial [Patescibacteria group bacterium]
MSGPGPVGWWRFEEQSGTAAFDASGNFNNATNTAALMPAWTSGGKVGGALKFDGSDDLVAITNGPIFDFSGGGSFTLAGWANPTTTNSNQTIVAVWGDGVGSNRQWFLQNDRAGFYDGSSNQITPSLDANYTNWHYYAVTYSKSNGTLIMYVDGVNKKSSTGLTSNATYNGALTLRIGNLDGSSQKMTGLIDEVKIYNYARSSRQIALDYNGGGPVEYWSFNEGYASTTYDGTGNINNTLTLQDNTLWTLSGKAGKALSFDGTNDQLKGATNAATSFSSTESHTYEAWVNWNGGTGYRWIIVGSTGTNGTQLALGGGANGRPTFWYSGGSSQYNVTPALTSGQWQHIAASYDANSNKVTIYVDGAAKGTSGALGSWGSAAFTRSVGGASAYYFDGSLDEVKIYNYARTPEEVRQDYNSGGGASGKSSNIVLGAVRNSASTWDDGGFGGDSPLAWWRFEEQTGTAAFDSSGNGHTATNTAAAMPVWTVVGKAGGALIFNGTTNGITALQSTDFTPSSLTI